MVTALERRAGQDRRSGRDRWPQCGSACLLERWCPVGGQSRRRWRQQAGVPVSGCQRCASGL